MLLDKDMSFIEDKAFMHCGTSSVDMPSTVQTSAVDHEKLNTDLKAYEEVLKTTNMNIIGITRVTDIIAQASSPNVQNCMDNMTMDDSASAQVSETNESKLQNEVELKIEVLLGKDKGNRFVFKLYFDASYPYKPPTAFLQPGSYLLAPFLQRYSNYIDMSTGQVHVPILTTAWNPVLDLSTIIFELQLFISNPE